MKKFTVVWGFVVVIWGFFVCLFILFFNLIKQINPGNKV